jgi:hypothetical protein
MAPRNLPVWGPPGGGEGGVRGGFRRCLRLWAVRPKTETPKSWAVQTQNLPQWSAEICRFWGPPGGGAWGGRGGCDWLVSPCSLFPGDHWRHFFFSGDTLIRKLSSIFANFLYSAIHSSPFKGPWGGGAGPIWWCLQVRGALEFTGDTFFFFCRGPFQSKVIRDKPRKTVT